VAAGAFAMPGGAGAGPRGLGKEEAEALRAGGAWGEEGGGLVEALEALRAVAPELLEGLRGDPAGADPQALAREVLTRAAERVGPPAGARPGPEAAGREPPPEGGGALVEAWVAVEAVRERLAALPAGPFCAEEDRQFALSFAPYAVGAGDDPRREAFQELREAAVGAGNQELARVLAGSGGAGPGDVYHFSPGDTAGGVLSELASRGALSCSIAAAPAGLKIEGAQGPGEAALGGSKGGRFGAFEFACKLSSRVVMGVEDLKDGADEEVDWVGQVVQRAGEDFLADASIFAAGKGSGPGSSVSVESSLCRAVWEGFFGVQVCPVRGVPRALPKTLGHTHRVDVRDPAGGVVGSLSQSDVLARLVGKGMGLGQMFFEPLRRLGTRAAQMPGGVPLLAARSDLVVVDVDMPLVYALHLIQRAGTECAAVLDQRGELVGTLSPKSLRYFKAGREPVLALSVGTFLAQVYSRSYGSHQPRLGAGGSAAEPFFSAHAREARSVLCGVIPCVAESEPLLAAMETMLSQRERCCWLRGEDGKLSGALYLHTLLRYICSCPLRQVL